MLHTDMTPAQAELFQRLITTYKIQREQNLPARERRVGSELHAELKALFADQIDGQYLNVSFPQRWILGDTAEDLLADMCFMIIE